MSRPFPSVKMPSAGGDRTLAATPSAHSQTTVSEYASSGTTATSTRPSSAADGVGDLNASIISVGGSKGSSAPRIVKRVPSSGVGTDSGKTGGSTTALLVDGRNDTSSSAMLALSLHGGVAAVGKNASFNLGQSFVERAAGSSPRQHGAVGSFSAAPSGAAALAVAAAANSVPGLSSRHRLIVDDDLDRVLDAYDAVDETDTGRIDFDGYCAMSRMVRVEVDYRAWKKLETFHNGNGYLDALNVVHGIFFPLSPPQKIKAEMRKRARVPPSLAADQPVTGEMEKLFAMYDTGEKGYVTLEDLTEHLPPHLHADLKHYVVEYSHELRVARQHDLREQQRLTVANLFDKTHLPITLQWDTLTSPPITIHNLQARWPVLEPQLITGLHPGHFVRLCQVVSVLRQHGPLAVMRLPWSEDLRQDPPPYNLWWEVYRGPDGRERNFIDPASVRLGIQQFVNMFTPLSPDGGEPAAGSGGALGRQHPDKKATLKVKPFGLEFLTRRVPLSFPKPEMLQPRVPPPPSPSEWELQRVRCIEEEALDEAETLTYAYHMRPWMRRLLSDHGLLDRTAHEPNEATASVREVAPRPPTVTRVESPPTREEGGDEVVGIERSYRSLGGTTTTTAGKRSTATSAPTALVESSTAFGFAPMDGMTLSGITTPGGDSVDSSPTREGSATSGNYLNVGGGSGSTDDLIESARLESERREADHARRRQEEEEERCQAELILQFVCEAPQPRQASFQSRSSAAPCRKSVLFWDDGKSRDHGEVTPTAEHSHLHHSRKKSFATMELLKNHIISAGTVFQSDDSMSASTTSRTLSQSATPTCPRVRGPLVNPIRVHVRPTQSPDRQRVDSANQHHRCLRRRTFVPQQRVESWQSARSPRASDGIVNLSEAAPEILHEYMVNEQLKERGMHGHYTAETARSTTTYMVLSPKAAEDDKSHGVSDVVESQRNTPVRPKSARTGAARFLRHDIQTPVAANVASLPQGMTMRGPASSPTRHTNTTLPVQTYVGGAAGGGNPAGRRRSGHTRQRPSSASGSLRRGKIAPTRRQQASDAQRRFTLTERSWESIVTAETEALQQGRAVLA